MGGNLNVSVAQGALSPPREKEKMSRYRQRTAPERRRTKWRGPWGGGNQGGTLGKREQSRKHCPRREDPEP